MYENDLGDPVGDVQKYEAPLVGEVSCVHGIKNDETITLTPGSDGRYWFVCPTCNLEQPLETVFIVPRSSKSTEDG